MRVVLEEQGEGQPAQRMAHIGMKGAVVLFDGAQQTDIVGKEDAAAAGRAMRRGVKGHHFVSFFHEGRDIGVEIPGGGFKPMGDVHFLPGRPGGQPAMTPDGVAGMAEGERLAVLEESRPFLCNPLPGRAKKPEGLYGRFPGGCQRKNVYPGACISKC